jgi:hypothetical protein
MSDAREIASKIVEEVKDSAHLFFTPVRVIVNEFNRAVHQQQPHQSGADKKPNEDPNYGRTAG